MHLRKPPIIFEKNTKIEKYVGYKLRQSIHIRTGYGYEFRKKIKFTNIYACPIKKFTQKFQTLS